MPDLSAVIITRNEEDNIARCLESLKIADEIIIVDSGSSDRTIEIAGSMGAEVLSHPWSGYGPAKREGVKRAGGPWILSLDADEVLTPELAEEINKVMHNGSDRVGYYVKRKTSFLGRWIYHSGWYPDYVLRLFLKSRGNFDNAVVHEKVVIDGPTGYLNGELLHYSYKTLEQYFDKFNVYTTLGARDLFRQGKRCGLIALTIKPAASFIKHYFTKMGFLDGLEGFVISLLSAASVFVKYLKLKEFEGQGRVEDGSNV